MGYQAGKANWGEIDQRERVRIASLIVAEQSYRAGESLGIANVDGEPRLLKATDVVAARRAASANGMPEAECTDTIGRLWAWGFLDHGRFAPDLLRDAGRRYAAAYWFRYGPVCGKTGAYSDMRGGNGGPPKQGYFDEGDDAIAEERFRRRDDAVRALVRQAKTMVDQVCVDGQGDNDPAWLMDEIGGYPVLTAAVRTMIARKELALNSGTKNERRLAKRRLDNSRGDLSHLLRDARREFIPHSAVEMLVSALDMLAAIDRSEGLHKPKRREKVCGDD